MPRGRPESYHDFGVTNSDFVTSCEPNNSAWTMLIFLAIPFGAYAKTDLGFTISGV
jgi:hypothetical protein